MERFTGEEAAMIEAVELAAAEDWLRERLENYLPAPEILRRIEHLRKSAGETERAPSLLAEEIVDAHLRLLED